jgi:hypothetical protein
VCGVAMAGERWRESDGRMKALADPLVVARGLAAEARELAGHGQKRRFPARAQG